MKTIYGPPSVRAQSIVAAMQASVDEMVSQCHLLGRPVVVWEDGKIVEKIPPAPTHLRERGEPYGPRR